MPRETTTTAATILLLCVAVAGVAVAAPPTTLDSSSFGDWTDFEDQTFGPFGTLGSGESIEPVSYEDNYSAYAGDSDSNGGLRYSGPPILDNDTDTVKVYARLRAGNDGQDNAIALSNNSSPDPGLPTSQLVALEFNDGSGAGSVSVRGSEYSQRHDVPQSISTGNWYNIYITYNTTETNVWIWPPGSSIPNSPDASLEGTSAGALNAQYLLFASSSEGGNYIDEVGLGTRVPHYDVSGTITDGAGNAIENATVSTDGGTSTTTNANGAYTLSLTNGTHNVTASYPGYESESSDVTVDGSNETQDFTLLLSDTDLEINTHLYLEHNTSATYEVVYNGSNGREGVTDSVTVTSGNTSVVTVDSGTQTINATDNVSINERTYIEAEYTTSGGETLRAQQNVTVANETVDNIEILPTWQRVSASLDDTTIQTIIVATMAGVAAGIFASSFASIAAFVMVMSVGWLAGRVGNGMIIATWMIGSFVGLNVALNINRRIK